MNIEEGRALTDFLKENFPGAYNVDVTLRSRWMPNHPQIYTWDVWVHFERSTDLTKQDVNLSESDLGVLKIKLEAEVASRKVLARLNAPAQPPV